MTMTATPTKSSKTSVGPEGAKVIAAAILAANGRTVLVDDRTRGVPSLAGLGVEPAELWRVTGCDHFSCAVVSAPRSARDLYRVLTLLEPLVTPGGVVLVLPYEYGDVAEPRFEATEAFLGVHAGWSRVLRPGNIVQLGKAVASTSSSEAATVTATVEHAADTDRDDRPAPEHAASKRVISFALFGEGGYWDFLPSNIRAYTTLFPGYEIRVHHDDAIDRVPYGAALKALADRGVVKLVRMEADGLARGKCRSMLWRLAPAWDPDVEYVFARDVDALPTWRERCVVEEFIERADVGEVDGSTCLDNIAHAGLMGGLCGFRADVLRRMYPSFEAFVDAAGFDDARWAQHGADQDHMNKNLAPRLSILEHAIFTAVGDDGAVFRRTQSTIGPHARLVTEVRSFDDPRVPEDVRAASERFVNYLGAAGHRRDDAIAYYDEHGVAAGQILVAEEVAGWSR